MNKTRIILASTGGVIAVGVLVAAYFLWSAFSKKTAAFEGNEESDGLVTVVGQVASLMNKKPYPDKANEKKLQANCQTFEDWYQGVRSVAAAGDWLADGDCSPAQFKELIGRDAKALSNPAKKNPAAIVAPDFAFGPFKDYIIEGKTYHLRPNDIVFVTAGEIHRPVFLDDEAAYERIVIYIASDFLRRLDTRAKLSQCFTEAREHGSVMHQLPNRSHDLLFHMDKLEKTAHGEGFANGLYTEILFIEFLILLNRSLGDHELKTLDAVSYDPKIQEVLTYINEHLADDLSIAVLAGHVFLSRYYLMKKFKADTGYSLHAYIRNKRLLFARDQLRTGKSITEISHLAGFRDYSTFSRAFHALFHCSPKEWRDRHEHHLDAFSSRSSSF